ncbi:hypothetical protein, partial [Allomesorhizobium alhagi]|uniref:hypothetical protein n=1 Tax=Allomesorhizobium alhagi TaxID=475067 RepID=UPI001300C2EF
VVPSRSDGSDWLVWWRRASLTNTEGSFAGISPGTALLADWQQVFGAATELDEYGCDDSPFSPEIVVDVDLELDAEVPPAARPPSSFVGFRPHYELPWDEEEDGFLLRFKEKDTLVSEFVPLYPRGGSSRRNLPLALYGLTTHGCSVPGDNSSCLAEIEIDPASEGRHALYEPYVAYDTRCISDPDHRLYQGAKAARGLEVCDRYRNFNHSPFISTRDGLPELVWIRRGNSAGAGYGTSALLRRAPRRDSTARGDLSGQRDNFDTFALDGYSERLEPSALLGESGEALVSVVHGGPIWRRCILLHRIEPRKIHEFRDKLAERSDREAACIDGLDRSWLERPWQMMADGTMLFFRTSLHHVAGAEEDEPERWEVRLEVAAVDPKAAGGPSAAIAPANIVGSIKLCRRASQDLRRSDARWVLRTGDCFDYANTELARGRDITKQVLAAARIMRSAPILVADMNGDEVPDIGVLLPGDGRDITHLRGLRDAEGLRWVAPATGS